MKLTLRTLLAYLDDMLKPAQVREIGQKLTESAQARELVDRIRSVVRRRRLIAPQESSETEIDPNDVAEYLDSVLQNEKIAQLEELCLKSDTNLAEVAGVHQILSMVLGKPVEISPASRKRIHQHCGSIPGKNISVSPVGPAITTRQGVSPFRGWHRPSAEDARERGPILLLVLLLSCALFFTVHKTLKPQQDKPADEETAAAKVDRSPETTPTDLADAGRELGLEAASTKSEKSEPDSVPENPATKTEPQEKPSSSPPDRSETIEPAGEEPKPKEKTEKLVPAVPVPPVIYVSQSGVLLRITNGELGRMKPNTLVQAGSELINPAGFRSRLTLGSKGTIELADLTKLRSNHDESVDLAFDFLEGSLILRSNRGPVRVRIGVGQSNFTFRQSGTNALVGLRLRLENPITSDRLRNDSWKVLWIYVIGGEIRIGEDQDITTLASGEQIELTEGEAIPAPQRIAGQVDWISGDRDSVHQGAVNRLETLIPLQKKAEDPSYYDSLILALLEAMTERNRDVRKLAVGAIGALEDTGALIDALRRPEYQDVRQSAIRSLRWMLRSDPAKIAAVENHLRMFYRGPDVGYIVDLLIGYSEQARHDPATYVRIVGDDLLESDELAVRELAIFNLRDMTGRDLGYSAEENVLRRSGPADNWRRWAQEQTRESLGRLP